MAISVNKVYTAVLSILNKKGNGELNPDHFNKIARIAQIDLLDQAFYEYNRAVTKETTGRGASYYGDIAKKTQDKIDAFFKSETSTVNQSGSLSVTEDLLIDTGDVKTDAPDNTYTNVLLTSTSGSGAKATVIVSEGVVSNITVTTPGSGYAEGAVLSMGTLVEDDGTIYLSNWTTTLDYEGDVITADADYGICLLPTDDEGVTEVYNLLKVSATNRIVDIERVDKSKLPFLLSSPLTAPSESFPAYYSSGNSITILPANTAGTWSLGDITIDYIKTPVDPIWSADIDVNTYGTPVYTFNSSTSTDFELHPSDEVELTLSILQYFGITIKDPAVVNAALSEKQNNLSQEQ